MKATKSQPKNFLDLPKKTQEAMLLKAAKSANSQQKALEKKFLKLRDKIVN